jgi:hypothetical protein
MPKSTCPKWWNGIFDPCSIWVFLNYICQSKTPNFLVVGEFDNVYFGKCKVHFGGGFQN